MGMWDAYEARMSIKGRTPRERTLFHTQDNIGRKIPNSLSSFKVVIGGREQQVTILSQKEDLTIKKICSMPGETLPHGGIVDFADSKWLITELDAVDEVYSSGIMRRCNYLLKWIDETGKVISRWCVVEDGTKYLIGEKSEQIMSIGDARIAITIGKDSDTNKLSRGRRFLVDDMDARDVLAYQITKPNKLFNVYNGHGVFRFILNEVNLTDNDNVKLRIADYYNWHPHIPLDNEHRDTDQTVEEIVEEAKSKEPPQPDQKVWL